MSFSCCVTLAAEILMKVYAKEIAAHQPSLLVKVIYQ